MSAIQKSTVKYTAGYELNVSRGVRLKFVALQMPLMLRFLRKFSTKFNKIQITLKFGRWKDSYFVWKQKYLAVLHRHTKAAIPIQSIIRGFNSRRRVIKLRSEVTEAVEEKKRWSMYQMQCFARMWVLKHRALKRSCARSMLKQNMAAIMVQKNFRGWLSRVHVIELEKLKLLRQLRKWSHGVSHHLVNMKEMKSGYSQSVLYQAIAITTLNSRPLRNLPPLSYVRTVRQSLYVLYWRLQTHYSAMRAEFLVRQKERRGMYLQDLFSGLVEMKLLGDRKKLLALQKEYEERLAREALEEQRRQAAAAHMLLSDFQHRQAVAARAKAEISLQNVYKAKLVRIAEAQKLVDDVEREGVLMHVEEVLSKTYAELTAQQEGTRIILAQEEKRVEQARLAGIAMYGEKASLSKTILSTQLQRLVPRIIKRPKQAPPPTAGELGVEKYREHQWIAFLEAVRRFGAYLRSLPLNGAYIRETCEALAASHKEVEFPGFPSSSTTSTAAKQQIVSALEHTCDIAAATLEEVVLNRQLEEEVFYSVMQPMQTLSALSPVVVEAAVQINGMLSRPQLVQLLGPQAGQQLSIAQPQYTMALQCSLAVDADAVTKMRFLLQLRRHRTVRVQGYKQLITQHVAFKQALAALHRKRREIHTTKYVTRQLRKTALQEAIVLERNVLQLRNSLVDLCSSFYRSFHEEVELFLCLFYPVEVKSEESHSLDEDATADKIVSKKGLFDSSNPGSVSYHATSDADLAARDAKLLALQQQQHAAALNTAKASPNPGRRGRKSSRIDAVYIAPKRSNTGTGAQTSKSFKNKRESVVYAGSGSSKNAHVLDPYHALHQLPVNKTLQHKLATPPKPIDRLHMYEDYWATVHLDMQYYQVSPADLACLPAAPIPTFHHDGKPHILKYSQTGASKRINASHVHKHFDTGTMNIQEKLKLKEAQLKHQKMMKKEVKLHDIPGFNLFQDSDDQEYDFSVWTEKVVIWARQVARWFRRRERSWRRHHRAQALTYLLRLQYLADSSSYSGGNSSSDSSSQQVEQQQHVKASNMLVRKKLLARLQQEEQRRGGRKAAHSLASVNENDSDFVERLHELNSLFLLRHLDQADVLDVFEVLLCKSNFGLKVSGAESKEVFKKTSTLPESKSTQGAKKGKARSTASAEAGVAVQTQAAALSRLVTADELDVTVAKHPASLTARFLLVQQALLQESAADSTENAFQRLRLSCQNTLLFGTRYCSEEGKDHSSQMEGSVPSAPATPAPSKQTSRAAAATGSDLYLAEGIFHASHPSLLLLASLQREVSEMRDIVTQLLRDHCLTLQLTPPSTAIASPGGGRSAKPNPATSHATLIPITVENFLIKLHYAKIRPVQYIQCEKTYEVWRYHFPSWMQPIVHFGSSAPKETFLRRLQYELRNGKDGIYARIDALDSRMDAAGRKLLRFLRQAVVLRRFVRNKCIEDYRNSVNQCLMQWEDTLAAAVRVDREARRVKEEQEKYTKKGFLRKLFSCFHHTAVFRRSARVIHSLSTNDDNNFDNLEENQHNTAATTARSSAKFNSFGWGFRPKYAKILVFTSEDELSAALKAELEQVLPVQVYSTIQHRVIEQTIMNALFQEICAVEANSMVESVTVETNNMVESVKTQINLQALVTEYAFLDSAKDCNDAVHSAVQARSEVTSQAYRRQCSWITGQEVHINQHGQHISEAQCSPESLAQAAKVYQALSVAATQTTLGDVNKNDTNHVSAALYPVPNKLASKLPLPGTKGDNTAQSVKLRIQADQLSLFTAAAQPVKEVYLGGGLRHLIGVLRVVEDGRLNPRGVAALHSLLLPHLEPQLPTMAQFQGTLNNTGSVETMKKSIAEHHRSAGSAGLGKGRKMSVTVRDGHKVVRLGSAETSKKPPKTAAEARKTITKFILKRSSSSKKFTEQGAGTGKPLLGDTAATSSSCSTTGVAVAPTESVVSVDIKTTLPTTSGNRPQSSLTRAATDTARASTSSSKTSQRNNTVKPLTTSISATRGSGKVRRGSITRSSLTTTATATSSRKPTEETARDTITKFLLSRAFNLSVSKRSKKYNYNGTKTRTEVRVRGLKTEVFAGKKIVRFMRARSKSRVRQLEEEKQKALAVAAAEKARQEAEALYIEAQRSEQQKDTEAVYCTTLFDLFTSARAGFSDRPLCQDRLWHFATVITSKSRQLCNLSIKMLRSQTERPIKALPTLHDLRSVLVVALFRERHLFATQDVPKKKAFLSESTAVKPLLLQSPPTTTAKRDSSRRCAEVIQGACRIFLARKIVAARRQARLQQRQLVQQ